MKVLLWMHGLALLSTTSCLLFAGFKNPASFLFVLICLLAQILLFGALLALKSLLDK